MHIIGNYLTSSYMKDVGNCSFDRMQKPEVCGHMRIDRNTQSSIIFSNATTIIPQLHATLMQTCHLRAQTVSTSRSCTMCTQVFFYFSFFIKAIRLRHVPPTPNSTHTHTPFCLQPVFVPYVQRWDSIQILLFFYLRSAKVKQERF